MPQEAKQSGLVTRQLRRVPILPPDFEPASPAAPPPSASYGKSRIGLTIYPVRVAGYLLATSNVLMAEWFVHGAVRTSAWVLVAAFLIHPHLGYLIYRKRGSQRRAEFTNLFLDMFLIGWLANFLDFRPALALPYAITNSAACYSVRGVKLLVWGLLSFAAGVATSVAVLGATFVAEVRLVELLPAFLYLAAGTHHLAYTAYTRGVSLLHANAVLLERDRLKDEVERISRHDLKTPLHSILSWSRLLSAEEDLAPDRRAALERVEQGAYRALSMVNLSLDLFKIEQGTYRLETARVDLAAVAERVVADLGGLAAASQVRCVLDVRGFDAGGPSISGDELLCYSALGNLLKNALEASPPGGTVTIGIAPEAPPLAGSTVTLRVHNQGVVPASVRPAFFEKYSTGGKSGGTGLGTYSARLLVEAQGGSIELDSSEAEGTTVRVRLPRARPGAPAAAGNAAAPPAGRRPADLLVVDDDPDNRALLRRLLGDAVRRIDEAGHGAAALEAFEEGGYDLVLMDVEMPVMDGISAAAGMRRAEAAQGGAGEPAVLVALSSHDDPGVRDRALAAGFDEVLRKPVGRPALLELLRRRGRLADPPPRVPRVELEDDLRDLVPGFLADKRAEVEDLGAALAEERRERVRRSSHRLRGAFVMYGFDEAARLCGEIEQAAGAGGWERVPRLYDALVSYLRDVEITFLAAGETTPGDASGASRRETGDV